ncbi:hypothetical protein, partial [Stenotrophomonas maltophilia]|uniref:hypothetical protein n=1 Tax=Stenotrophomonas maltophilia TaxID=40324 RepID=UPI001A7E169D
MTTLVDTDEFIRYLTDVSTKVDTYQQPRRQPSQLPTAAGICQRRGGVGVRGVSRMDAAAKPYLIGIWQRRCREPAW